MGDKKFGTLNSLNKREGSGSDSNDEDERRTGQGFFVGGSEHSGQQVLGPPRQDAHDDPVMRLFDGARRHGAELIPPDNDAPQQRQAAGYRLGDSVVSSTAASDSGQNPDQAPSQRVVLNFYNNGFIVDDGPLRTFSDPQSAVFMNSISQGHIPLELLRLYPGRHIDLRMERKPGDYEPPRVVRPFSGQGQRLGEVLPEVVGAGTVGQKFVPPKTSEKSKIPADPAQQWQTKIGLRPGEPTTEIRLRIPGQRDVTLRLNHSHTISDIRNVIVSIMPEVHMRPFTLATPPQNVVRDEDKTLEELGLLRSVLVVKYVNIDS